MSFPEEIIFATLARINKQQFLDTGIVVQNHDKRSRTYPLCPRKTLWNYAIEYCYGENRRWMCNLGFRDLNQIYSSNQPSCLFINKFDLNVDSRPVLCLREHFTKFY